MAMQKRTLLGLIYTIFSAVVIVGGTVLAVRWANGDFRRDRGSGQLASETGLLNATSSPVGAGVYIDGRLTSATDNVLYLQPGEYQVTIYKDGYSNWQKTLQIDRGLVTNTAARLFPSSPNLSGLTFTGAENLSVSPDGQKLLFFTASASAEIKNGLYILDIGGANSSNPKNARQIVRDDASHELAKAKIIWSSDSNEILLETAVGNYLLPVTETTDLSLAPDVTFQIQNILATWEEDIYLREREMLVKFPPEIIKIATSSAKNVYFSPDKKKLIYTATASASLPDHLLPLVPAASTQPQERTLEPGVIYVYDMSEDRNFRIGTENFIRLVNKDFLLADDALSRIPTHTLANSDKVFSRLRSDEAPELNEEEMLVSEMPEIPDTPMVTASQKFAAYYSSLHSHTWQWLSDSRHLVGIADNKIVVVEYDGANPTTVYSGPFLDSFVYPWADGSRILILTSFSPDYPPNIYSIELVK